MAQELKIGRNLQAFLDKSMRENGWNLLTAAMQPGARVAEALDKADTATKQHERTADEFLGADRNKPFASAEQRKNAFAVRDAQGKKLYDTSPEYRKAVQHKLSLSSDEVAGLHRPLNNLPTDAEMLKQARFEAYQEGRKELFEKSCGNGPGAARARLQLMEFDQSQVPEIKAMIAEHERNYADAHPLEMELKAAKARGERVGTPLTASHEQAQAVEAHPFDAWAADKAGAEVQGE